MKNLCCWLYCLALPLCSHADTGSSHNFFYLNKIDDERSFVVRANLATRNGADLFFGYVDGNFRFKIDDSWSYEVGYRQASLELANKWRNEYRPMINLTYRGKTNGWKFSNRHRVEFRYFEGDTKHRIRYRNESVWISPKKVTQYNLTPYVSEEVFFNATDKVFNANWLTFGVSKPFGKRSKWKLGYRWQNQKFGGEWSTRHVLVTGISILNFDL